MNSQNHSTGLALAASATVQAGLPVFALAQMPSHPAMTRLPAPVCLALRPAPTPRHRHALRALVTLSVHSALWLGAWAAGMRAAEAAEAAGTVRIQAQQASSLGVRSQAVRVAGEPAAANSGNGNSGAAPNPAAGPARVSHPAVVLVPATQQRVVAAAAEGLIESLGANPGDVVKAGQPMARLRSPQLQALRRDILQANSHLELARVNLGRDELLLKDGMVSPSRVEVSRAQWVQAQAQARERQHALQHLASAGARTDGDVLTLTAPIHGRVMEVMASVGQRVDAMTPLYKVATLNPMWLDIQVPMAAASAMRVGDAVSVPLSGTTAGGAASLSGQVISLGAEVDKPTQTLLVRARVTNPLTPQGEPTLRPGQMVSAQVSVAARAGMADAVGIPANALLSGQGGQSRVIVDLGQGRYQLTPVTVLGKDSLGWQVSGLSAGSRVVTQGSAALLALLAH